MDTTDEIPLEDHPYFQARLSHLERHNPATLLGHLEQGTLTDHLREITGRAMQAKANLVFNAKLPEDQANELVMSHVVADPMEWSRLCSPGSWIKLLTLLDSYKTQMNRLPRTYQSQSETIE